MAASGVEDIYELSPLQRGMLLHAAYDGDTDMYMGQHVFAVDGPLDTDALERAWRRVFAAHPALRTSFHWEGLEKPLQVVHSDVLPAARRGDWSHIVEPVRRARLGELLADDRARGFDLATPPLQRLHLVRTGDDRHLLVWSHHHLLLDGWSVPVFMNEVMAHYAAITVGGPAPPPAPPYRDYIAWLHRQDAAEAERFWAGRFRGFEPRRLVPLRDVDPAGGTGEVERHTLDLPDDLEAGLRACAARHRVTLGTVLHAVWAVVLRRCTGTSPVVFGSVTSGRPAELPDVDRMVGLFANTLPVSIDVPDDGDLGEWLRAMQTDYAHVRRYEHSPLAEIKKWVGLPGAQLFDSLFVLDNYSFAVQAGGVGEALSVHAESRFDKVSVPVSLIVTPSPVSQVQLLLHRDRVDAGFADDVLARVRAVLEEVVVATTVGPLAEAAGPLLGPVARAGPAAAGFVPLATSREEEVAAVFGEVLGVEEVGATTSFFEIGGDSFAAVRAIGRIDGATISMLAAHPVVRDLAKVLDTAAGALATDSDDGIADLGRTPAEERSARRQRRSRMIPRVSRGGKLVCTHVQEQAWRGKWTDYHIPFALRLTGEVDTGALGRAVLGLVTRHEALRTRFFEQDGTPYQVIDLPPARTPFVLVDLDHEQIVAWVTEEVQRELDLTAGPVFGAALARLTPTEGVLVLSVHHFVSDGWSLRVLTAELSQLYAAEVAGTDAGLPEVPVQLADYAAWQRDWLRGEEPRSRLRYWQDQLEGLELLEFPPRRPEPGQDLTGASLRRDVPEDVCRAVHGYARAHGVSLLSVLHAALVVVLHRRTGQTDISVSSSFSGRSHAELETVLANLAVSLILRARLSDAPTFAELVRRCHRLALGAAANQDVPLQTITEAMHEVGVPDLDEAFRVHLTLEPRGHGLRTPHLGDVVAEPLAGATGDNPGRLELTVNEFDDSRLDLLVDYIPELLDAEWVGELVEEYFTTIATELARPDRVIGTAR